MTPTAMQNYNQGGYDFDDELFQGPPLHMNSQASQSRPHHYPSPVNVATNGFAIPSPIASPAFSDTFSISGEPRSASQNSRRPPASKWESVNGGFIPYPGNGPALPRPVSNSNSNGTRSRPTTPATFDAHNLIREPQSEPPSRPLTAKSSYSDMRGSDITSAPFENFSRPRKHSIRQPISDTPSRSRPALLPTPSEDGPEMLDYAPPWRPRGPSMCSNVSASTWAPGMSPTTAEFPDSRGLGTRLLKNAGPPPVSATRPQYGFGRTDSSGSAPILGGAVPWSGGEELRSSFRSQLTASTAPGTANTERSSVLTKNSSATSFGDNADAFVDPDEPSLEDVMGMYEQGFEDDIYEQSDAGDDQEEFPLRPSSSYPQPEPSRVNSGTLDDPADAPDSPDSPMLAKTRLDAEIRQSKMFFSSPAFMASVPHLASNMNTSSHFDETNRDSAKSLDTDPSDSSQPTVTSSNDPNDRGLGIANNSASRDNSPSPAPTSLYDSRPSSPDPPPRDPSYPESCLPPDVPGPVEPEAPNSRDRYGFKKENTYISMKQYDDWNAGYTEYLARRKKKWQSYLKEHSLMTENPNRFPPSNAKTKKFVRKGIPPEWRGAAWFYYAGGPAILAKHSGLYGKVLDMKAKRVDVEAIERDLHRTFPDNINFKPPQAPSDVDQTSGKSSKNKEQPIIASLRRVLFAFSIYNPHIGYCQSLNFIAGLLLLFLDTEEQCFWLLNVITHLYLPGTHEISLEGSKVDLGVLMTEIRDTMPTVWDKIGGDLEADPQSRPSTSRSFRKPRTRFRRKQTGALPTERLPPITLCMTAWFMSCFIGTLPIETTLRVWDIFFYEGSKTLFRTALAIFKTGEPEIMAVSDPMEMFGVVQAMPRRMLDANGLIDACFKRRNGFSHLSQGVIDERRQERRDQAQVDKDKQSGRSQTLPPSANGTNAQSEVRRKGTLFGRRRRDVSDTMPGRA